MIDAHMQDSSSVPADSAEASAARRLAEQIRDGDSHAETELVRRYGRGVRMLLERRVRDVDSAQDIYQETFQRVILRLRENELNDPDRLIGFIHKTAVNLAVGQFRREGRRRLDTSRDSVDEIAEAPDNPYVVLEREQRHRAVMSLISELEIARDRELLLRYYVQDTDKHQLCRDFGLTADHFDRVLFRARQRLKQLLEAETPAARRIQDRAP